MAVVKGKGYVAPKKPKGDGKKPDHPVLSQKEKQKVQKLKDLGVENPRKFFIAGQKQDYTWKQILSAAKNEGQRYENIVGSRWYEQRTGGGTSDRDGGGSTYDGSRPRTDTGSYDRVGGGVQGSESEARGAPAFFDSGGGAGGGAGGGNPLTAGTAESAIGSGDIDRILHGGKRKGRIRRTRGTE